MGELTQGGVCTGVYTHPSRTVRHIYMHAMLVLTGCGGARSGGSSGGGCRGAGAAMASPYLEEARAMIQERNAASNMNVVDMARK